MVCCILGIEDVLSVVQAEEEGYSPATTADNTVAFAYSLRLRRLRVRQLREAWLANGSSGQLPVAELLVQEWGYDQNSPSQNWI